MKLSTSLYLVKKNSLIAIKAKKKKKIAALVEFSQSSESHILRHSLGLTTYKKVKGQRGKGKQKRLHKSNGDMADILNDLNKNTTHEKKLQYFYNIQ